MSVRSLAITRPTRFRDEPRRSFGLKAHWQEHIQADRQRFIAIWRQEPDHEKKAGFGVPLLGSYAVSEGRGIWLARSRSKVNKFNGTIKIVSLATAAGAAIHECTARDENIIL